MPQFPSMDIVQAPVGVPRGPRENAFTQAGDALGKTAEAVGYWDKIVRENDIANELSRATTDYMVKSDEIARNLKDENVGHADYVPEFEKRHKALVGDIEKSFKYPEARASFAKGMADNYARTLINARNDARKMFIADETAELDTSTQMNAALFVNNAGNPERQRQILDNYKEVLKFKQERGVIDANKAGDLQRAFVAKTMNLEAAKDPSDFITRVDRGEYTGSDPTDLQRALDIAIKVGDARARRDEKEGKAQSEAAERKFEDDAANRKLNPGELDMAAKRYGWDKNKVDGLLKMQLGLKVANPYEKLLIEDAMAPADRNAIYTLGDVQEAEKNLKTLAKQGQASANSEDYRSAMRRLQSMRDRLDIRSDVKDRTSNFDARQAIHDLYGEFLPGNNSRTVIAEKNANLSKLDTMNPQQREKFVADLRREFEKKRQENQGPQIDREKLRGQQVK